MNSSSQGVISIQRPRGYVAAGFNDFIVRIDGQEKGRVERGSVAHFAIDPGEHTVDVSMDWGWLRPRRVVVEPGTKRELAISRRSGGALKLYLPMLLAIMAAVATLAVLRQLPWFAEANWWLRWAMCLVGFAGIYLGYWCVTRKLGTDYWDYWSVYTLEPAKCSTDFLNS